ncbi:MAG: glycosyltransferase family 2 protein [Treponema sp.]|nr:glycosyltransferase family 2 protein [Treponema sp.]
MKKTDRPILVIIIPCFNEEEAFPETAELLSAKMMQLVSSGLVSRKSLLLFIDDGSRDSTWALIEEYHRKNPELIGGIKLAGNRGQQNALLCGLLSARNYADIAISIDADLQDDIEAIDKMLASFYSGSEIVCGVRSGRESDSFYRKAGAFLFYGIMRFLGSGIMYNHAEFRLMSRKAINALAEYNGVYLFIRAIVPLLGLKTGAVYYDSKKRRAGKSKYTAVKLLKLAIAGIVSFGILRNYKRKKRTVTKYSPGHYIEKKLFPPELINAG